MAEIFPQASFIAYTIEVLYLTNNVIYMLRLNTIETTYVSHTKNVFL